MSLDEIVFPGTVASDVVFTRCCDSVLEVRVFLGNRRMRT